MNMFMDNNKKNRIYLIFDSIFINKKRVIMQNLSKKKVKLQMDMYNLVYTFSSII